MALSGSGMKQDIIDELPGEPDLESGGGDKTIQAIARCVVSEIADHATANVTTESEGVCSNVPGPPPAPGPYTGTGSLAEGGTISGLSSSRLKAAIKSEIENLLSGVDWSKGGSDECVEAVSEAICAEVQDYGKVTVTTTETGTVPAGGGPVSGSGTGIGTVVGLSASRLKSAIKSNIESKIGEGIDFSKGDADANIGALATGVVNHIHDNAQVAVTTDLSTIICPPSGGSPAATQAMDPDADVS